MVYLIHFEQPFGHARHYLGYCRDGTLQIRLTRHRNGCGAKLLDHVTKAGIAWEVVRTWTGGRRRERQIKIQGGAARVCPVCQAGWRRPGQCKP